MDYHKRNLRRGHFWISGYGASVIDTDSYALVCMRYLDRNPMRANMVNDLKKWPWSSYARYVLGKPNPLVTPHPTYLGLADDEGTRQQFYHQFVHSIFPSDETRERMLIRHAVGLKRRTFG